MDDTLKELIEISNTVGRDNTLVRGGFGNTSVKTADGKFMYIKASGTALKEMNSKRGWRRLRIDSVLAVLKDKSIFKMSIVEREAQVGEMLIQCCDDKVKKDVRPSIESCFHAILDKYVIHLHPRVVLAYACAENGREELEKLFKDESPPFLWVPFANPGSELAGKMEQFIEDYKKRNGMLPQVMFLQNHGLVVTAGDSKSVLKLVDKVIDTCKRNLEDPKAAALKILDGCIDIEGHILEEGRRSGPASGQ